MNSAVSPPSGQSASDRPGKTVAAVLPWLYRRLDRRLVSAPERTPRRLVYVLPLHSLAEQTFVRVGEWLDRLGCAEEVGLHLLAGESARDGVWRRHPERVAILVGTVDMLLSRALMRGFAYLETLVRVADWRSSARHDGPVAGLM